jgi:ubiquinone/menaquinone biosynthesis C-methylase UbiE
MLSKYVAAQLRKPSGLIGKLVFSRLLNRENIRINKTTLDALNLNDNDSVLEIGFGGGALLEMILESNSSCYVQGADISPEMVSFCERKLKKHISQKRLRTTCSSISNLPYSNEEFSKVCSVNNLYFWPSIEKSLMEIMRVLKKGGLVVIAVESQQSMEKHDCTKHNFKILEESEIETALILAGFKEISTVSCKTKTDDYVAFTGHKI